MFSTPSPESLPDPTEPKKPEFPLVDDPELEIPIDDPKVETPSVDDPKIDTPDLDDPGIELPFEEPQVDIPGYTPES